MGNLFSRREFLAASAATVGAAAFAGVAAKPKAKPRLAVQMVSIRKAFWKDPVKNLGILRAAGIEGIEFFDYGPADAPTKYSAKELKQMLGDAGMVACGTHTVFGWGGDAIKKQIDFCLEGGFESFTCACPVSGSADGCKSFGRLMSRVADQAAKSGLKVSIHNHGREFERIYDGVNAWDLLYRDSSPNLLQQIDVSPVVHLGKDPVALLKQYRNRHHSIHAKENGPSPDGILGHKPTDGGKLVPWDGIVAYLKTEPDFRWYVIECECDPSSMKAVLESAKFLSAKIKS